MSANSGGFDQAIDGGFPPGSTFKVITSTALITPRAHPAVGGELPGRPPPWTARCSTTPRARRRSATLLQAFTESCNTAFIQLATGAPDARRTCPAAATMLGVGRSLHLGLVSFDGSVPQPSDQADLAATSIGQGRVLMSPLSMAMVAAAADTGTVRTPQLVRRARQRRGASAGDEQCGTPATSQLPADVVSDLHKMMASVVASGTAAGQGLPAGTYAKTGTAQYGTTTPLKIDAWLMGFKGNTAFACLVVDSTGDGGPTCGPIVARFLSRPQLKQPRLQ